MARRRGRQISAKGG
jgi:hypothetical protein